MADVTLARSADTPNERREAHDVETHQPVMLTRGQVAKRLGRSVMTVRRMQADGRLTPVIEGGVSRFSADEVEALADQIDDEDDAGERSELAVRTQAVGDMVASAQSYAEAAFGLMLKGARENAADTRQTIQALLAENRRLSEREAARESEFARLRAEHRQWEDALAASARADREADHRARRTEILLNGAIETTKYAAPAFASFLGRLLKVDLPESRIAAVQRILAGKTTEERMKLARIVVEYEVLTADQRARFLENPINFLEIIGELDAGERAGLILALKNSGVFSELEWSTLAMVIEVTDKENATTKAQQVSAADAPPPDTASLEERNAWLMKRSADFTARMDQELAALDEYAKRLDADSKTFAARKVDEAEGSSG